jgi:hypothetical protein
MTDDVEEGQLYLYAFSAPVTSPSLRLHIKGVAEVRGEVGFIRGHINECRLSLWLRCHADRSRGSVGGDVEGEALPSRLAGPGRSDSGGSTPWFLASVRSASV